MQSLTTAQSAALTGHRLEVSAGCELLDLGLNVTGDISDDLVGGSVSWNGHATIHTTCRLGISTELAWGSVLVRPYMLVNGHRFNRGVFSIVTPEKPVGETPATFSCQGMDRLYLLDREVGADFTVTAGTTYRAALIAVFAAAGLSGYLIDGSAADSTLPVDKPWPLVPHSDDPDQTSSPVTYLRQINDLLRAINFRGVWCDENGVYRCQAYQEPSVRAPEAVFDADDPNVSIVGEDRTVVADMWKTPNRWVFIRSNLPDGAPSPTEGAGIYTVVNQSDGPTSIDARGLTWTKVYEYEAASQAALVGLGNRRVAHDRRMVTTINATTGPWPVAGHADIYTLNDSALGGSLKVAAVGWEMDLLGGDVSWTFERVG